MLREQTPVSDFERARSYLAGWPDLGPSYATTLAATDALVAVIRAARLDERARIVAFLRAGSAGRVLLAADEIERGEYVDAH